MNRDDLEDRIGAVISGCPADATDVHSVIARTDARPRVDAVMDLVDAYIDALRNEEELPEETWDAARVAEYLDLRDAAAARSTLSRNQIKAVSSGGKKALYPAAQVRALRVVREIRK